MGWAAAGYVVAAIGTAASAYGQVQQGQNQSAWASYNAKMAERDARTAEQNAKYAAAQKRKETKRMLGRQRALYGKAGVTMEGSPLIVQQETAAEGEMDALMIERGYSIEAQRLRAEKELYKVQGAAARKAGYWGAGTTLLTSAGKAARQYGGR
jgi:hypothetical protein